MRKIKIKSFNKKTKTVQVPTTFSKIRDKEAMNIISKLISANPNLIFIHKKLITNFAEKPARLKFLKLLEKKFKNKVSYKKYYQLLKRIKELELRNQMTARDKLNLHLFALIQEAEKINHIKGKGSAKYVLTKNPYRKKELKKFNVKELQSKSKKELINYIKLEINSIKSFKKINILIDLLLNKLNKIESINFIRILFKNSNQRILSDERIPKAVRIEFNRMKFKPRTFLKIRKKDIIKLINAISNAHKEIKLNNFDEVKLNTLKEFITK